jgi:predicted Ser/Thr protein kinase
VVFDANRDPVVDGRFELLAPAGAGGMGIVYRARDRETGARVALKLVRAEGDPQRFEREARLLAGLSHPGIVRYVAHGRTAAGESYLAMEWLEGEDLAQHLRRGRLEIDDVMELARRLTEALEVAHDAGVIHRDLKPSNVHLEGGVIAGAKLIDFGLARHEATAVALTASGMMLGTPGYMAPEQARGASDLDARVDVFALGAVLYECLAGEPAFAGDQALAILAKLLLEDPPPIRERRRQTPASLARLVHGCLAKDPAERPATMAAVRNALDLVVSGAPPPSSSGAAKLSHGQLELMTVLIVRGAARDPTATLTPEQASAENESLDVVRRHGAVPEVLADGSLLAAFHGDAEARDHTLRAVRCAFELARAPGEDRVVALASGRGQVAGRLPIGEVIDRAVRLLPKRGSGVFVDSVTQDFVAEAFVGQPAAGDAYELIRERPADADGRKVLGRTTPFVGRTRELVSSVASLEVCLAHSAAGGLVIAGDPGVGKSRLLRELLGRLSVEPAVLGARCDPATANSAYSVVTRLLASAVAEPGGKISEGGARAFAERHAGGETASAELLAWLLGVASDPPSDALRAALDDPMLFRDRLRAVWSGVVRALTARGPLVVAIEDLHWADRPSVDLLGYTLSRVADRGWAVIATARPELDARFPELWGDAEVQVVRLRPLREDAGRELLRSILGDDLPAERADEILELAAGNALFLEELARAHSEGSQLPSNVLGTMSRRLRSLDSDSALVLRASSVFGETFWAEGVRELLPPSVAARLSETLERLVEREFLVRREASRFAPAREHAFCHRLMRDVV